MKCIIIKGQRLWLTYTKRTFEDSMCYAWRAEDGRWLSTELTITAAQGSRVSWDTKEQAAKYVTRKLGLTVHEIEEEDPDWDDHR